MVCSLYTLLCCECSSVLSSNVSSTLWPSEPVSIPIQGRDTYDALLASAELSEFCNMAELLGGAGPSSFHPGDLVAHVLDPCWLVKGERLQLMVLDPGQRKCCALHVEMRLLRRLHNIEEKLGDPEGGDKWVLRGQGRDSLLVIRDQVCPPHHSDPRADPDLRMEEVSSPAMGTRPS